MLDRSQKRIVPSCSDANVYASRKGEIFVLKNDGTFEHRPGSSAGRIYARVHVRKNGDKAAKLHTRSQLVAEAFLGPKPGGCQVDHKRNKEKLNDSVSNLQYLPSIGDDASIGNIQKDMHNRDMRPVGVIAEHVKTGVVREFASMNQCAKAINRQHKTVSNTVNGLQRTCGGYYLKKA